MRTKIILYFAIHFILCNSSFSQCVMLNDSAKYNMFGIKKVFFDLPNKKLTDSLDNETFNYLHMIYVNDYRIPIDTLVKYNCVNITLTNYEDKELPEFLQYYDKVEWLEIYHYVSDISNNGGPAYHNLMLKDLHFSGYKLEKLNRLAIYSPCPNLSIPSDIIELKSLRELYLDNWLIGNIDYLYCLQNLEVLYLERCLKGVIDIEKLSKLQNLRELHLNTQDMDSIKPILEKSLILDSLTTHRNYRLRSPVSPYWSPNVK